MGAGDIIYFPKGSHAEWTVERYVRKLAFCRTALPGYLVTARNAARRLKSLVRPGSAAGRSARPLKGPGPSDPIDGSAQSEQMPLCDALPLQ